jgi:uncharacterized protein (TIGR02452 family)
MNRKKHDQNQFLIDEYYDTKHYFRDLDPRDVPKSLLYDIRNIDISAAATATTTAAATVRVISSDTLDAALEYHYGESEKILVLNMASKFKPGGGVESGRTAQEECIFRRTNGFMTHPKAWYPLSNYEIIYSPQVYIVKDSDYNLLRVQDQKEISMLAVHAMKNPKITATNSFTNETDKELTTLKIESIFKVAIKHGHKTLILGALGCGAYRNPPIEIAKFFQQMIEKYQMYFDEILFAIRKSSADDENFAIFSEILLSGQKNC